MFHRFGSMRLMQIALRSARKCASLLCRKCQFTSTSLASCTAPQARTKDPLDTIREAVSKETKQRQILGSASHSPYKVVLLGGPGVGKGTWGSLMAEFLSIPHISTGDLVRAELSKPLVSSYHTAKELKVHEHVETAMNQGKLLPDHIMVELLLMRLQDADPSVGFVLDGFPRTLVQATMLNDVVGHVDLALNFQLDDEALVAKCLGRRVCRDCGKDYNLSHVDTCKNERRTHDGVLVRKRIFLPTRLPPRECLSKLKLRADDSNEGAVRERLRLYLRESKDLQNYYCSKGKLVDVDVGPGAQHVWARLLDVVQELESDNAEMLQATEDAGVVEDGRKINKGKEHSTL